MVGSSDDARMCCSADLLDASMFLQRLEKHEKLDQLAADFLFRCLGTFGDKVFVVDLLDFDEHFSRAARIKLKQGR